MADLDKIISEVIRAACQAPSGDNSQPWRFETEGDTVWAYVIPGTDLPFYNYRQRGSLTALGAAIENMVLAAAHLGAQADVVYFPPDAGEHCVAKISLTAKVPAEGPWFPAIFARATNRHPYRKESLPEIVRAAAQESMKENIGAKVVFLEDPVILKNAGRDSAWNERTVLESEHIRPEFFSHAVWTQDEELEKRTGLFVKTLEMNPVAQLIFRAYSTRLGAKFFNALGFSKIIASENAKLYAASAAVAAFSVNPDEDLSYVHLGRLMQRVWLAATVAGWSGQPVTGVPFLMQGIRAGLAPWVADSRKKELENAYFGLHRMADAQDGTFVALLRLGPAPAPSARSSRFSAESRTKKRNI
jgi:hypothetical protein